MTAAEGLPDRTLYIIRLQAQVEVLTSCAREWEGAYEAITRESGAFKNIKIRGAYRLAAVLATRKAAELTKQILETLEKPDE